jgi:hypothetical protein
VVIAAPAATFRLKPEVGLPRRYARSGFAAESPARGQWRAAHGNEVARAPDFGYLATADDPSE